MVDHVWRDIALCFYIIHLFKLQRPFMQTFVISSFAFWYLSSSFLFMTGKVCVKETTNYLINNRLVSFTLTVSDYPSNALQQLVLIGLPLYLSPLGSFPSTQETSPFCNGCMHVIFIVIIVRICMYFNVGVLDGHVCFTSRCNFADTCVS